MKAHEVPITLFNRLAEVAERDEGAPKRERYAIEGCSDEADVICLGDVWIGDVWISCATYSLFGIPCSNFRLWPGKPERESGLVHSPEPVFKIFAGPSSDGMWAFGRGDRYTTRVVVDYGYFSKIDLTSEKQRHLLEVANRILAEASLLSRDVESVTVWDASTAEHA